MLPLDSLSDTGLSLPYERTPGRAEGGGGGNLFAKVHRACADAMRW